MSLTQHQREELAKVAMAAHQGWERRETCIAWQAQEQETRSRWMVVAQRVFDEIEQNRLTSRPEVLQ